MKFLKSPLIQFLLIGAVVYLVYSLYEKQADDATNTTVVITAREVEWLETTWRQRWRRTPTEA